MIGSSPGGSAAWLLPFVIVGCQTVDLVAVGALEAGSDNEVEAGRDGQVEAGSDNQVEAGTDSGSGGTPQCSASAVSIVRSDGHATEICSGQIAARTFTHAICSCGDISFPEPLATSESDSGFMHGSASVGVNGNIARSGSIHLDGSLKVASALSIVIPGEAAIRGDLWLAGSAGVAGVLNVDRDAWITQTVSTVGAARIGRDLHQAPGATLTNLGVVLVTRETKTAPFTFAKPCACDPAQLLDIAGWVNAARTVNDNAAVGLHPEAFDAASDTPIDIELPCGRLFLPAFNPSGAVHLKVTGHVALFVESDVVASSGFALELGPEAELDWFVLGSFSLDPAAGLGDPSRPAATRVYVRGDKEIHLPGTAKAAFNLYAPSAPVIIDGTDVYGSVFAGTVNANPSMGRDMNSSVTFHYDSAVIRAGASCLAETGTCQVCAQCNAGAECLANACFTCTSDNDCCVPFVCTSGKCKPLTF